MLVKHFFGKKHIGLEIFAIFRTQLNRLARHGAFQNLSGSRYASNIQTGNLEVEIPVENRVSKPSVHEQADL